MSETKRYLTLNELALETGRDPQELDQAAERSGAKRFHSGFGCFIYDRKKIPCGSVIYKPGKAPEEKDLTQGKRYLTKNELAQILKTDPETAGQIGEAAGALIHNGAMECDLYDRELITKHAQEKKDHSSGVRIYTQITDADRRKIHENAQKIRREK